MRCTVQDGCAEIRYAFRDDAVNYKSIERSTGRSGAARLADATPATCRVAIDLHGMLQTERERATAAETMCPASLSGTGRTAFILMADDEIAALTRSGHIIDRLRERALVGNGTHRPGIDPPRHEPNLHRLGRAAYLRFQELIIDYLVGLLISNANRKGSVVPVTTCPVCLEDTRDWGPPRGLRGPTGPVVIKFSPGCLKHAMCHGCCRELLNRAHRGSTMPRCPCCARPIHVRPSRGQRKRPRPREDSDCVPARAVQQRCIEHRLCDLQPSPDVALTPEQMARIGEQRAEAQRRLRARVAACAVAPEAVNG